MICHIQGMSGIATLLQSKQMTNDRHIKLQLSNVEIREIKSHVTT